MKMYEIQPMGTLATLLDKFNDLGGVLDYVLIALAGPIPSDYNPYDLHKAAAVFTVQTAYTRNPNYPGRGPRIEPEKAHGVQITPVKFFAPPYVWVDSTDLSASPYREIINPGELLALPQVQKEGDIYVSTQGYAWAFSDPPIASLRMRWRTSSTKSINSSLAMIWQHLPFIAGRPVGQTTLTQVPSGGEVFCGRFITRARAALSVVRLQPLISSTASMHCATIIYLAR